VVWKKSNGGMGTFYRSQHELVFVYKVGTAPHTNTFGLGDTGRYRTNVWDYPGVNSFGANQKDLALHPTVKPVALVVDAIKDVTKRGDIVLDGFGGSGTTLLAAERTGRIARLVELDPLYCDVICRSYEAKTGQPARLDGTTQTFCNVATGRPAEIAPRSVEAAE
jgi:DNA modification methylase